MDLNVFMALVDARSALSSPRASNGDDALLAQIRACFTLKESDQARSDLGHIIDDLGLRYMCEQATVDPYLGVAETIRQALREHGNLGEAASNWEHAVELAAMYTTNSTRLPSVQVWRSNTRVNCLSVAINELRKLGYNIGLPASGGVDVPESETKRLAQDIQRKAASLGHALALSASGAMRSMYSAVTGRFNVGRNGQTVQIDAKPARPLAYLYQLGLRYFAQPPSVPFPEATLAQLVDLVSWATALLDMSVATFELMFARNTDMVRLMQKSVVYDSVFLLTQAKPTHAREYLEWMMSRAPLANLKDKRGRTSAQIMAAATMLLRGCERACAKDAPHDFIPVSAQSAAYATNLDLAPAADLLREVFTHTTGANQTLTFPPNDMAVDAAFRPLLVTNGTVFMQPAPMAARATVNAALQWCRENWSKGNFDEKAVGPLFEDFVREKLAQHGVSVLHGNYKAGQSKSQCDAVVETEASVIVFELKSKMLRRQSRSGDDVAAMADLAQALVRPQAQAMERHAVLREHGAITLTRGTSTATIKLGSREVLKLSITRGDLGSLHDRPFLGPFLRTGCVVEFIAVDPRRQQEFDSLHEWFQKLKAAAARAEEPIFETAFPFSTSWSLSVFQLLLLLERTSDNESFAKELQRTRRMITPLRDFYSEYEYALKLGQFRDQEDPQTN
ncbi:hypothetical protein CJO94_12070 [Ralstonia solanacearum]|nr:hypothetical protein CJO94_12070 [Ralstonia solanacearum]